MPLHGRWQFTKSGRLPGPSGKRVKGQFVKVNHWPSLSISRKSDWGWRMENCWVVYESMDQGMDGCTVKEQVIKALSLSQPAA